MTMRLNRLHPQDFRKVEKSVHRRIEKLRIRFNESSSNIIHIAGRRIEIHIQCYLYHPIVQGKDKWYLYKKEINLVYAHESKYEILFGYI